jgi:AcrR family transcriptional regulator
MAAVPTAKTPPSGRARQEVPKKAPGDGHVRRTQAERSEATREALLDATIESLVEDGYAKTTTGGVAERAGVSRGAHLHHFQTREALVAAAVERLARRRSAEQLAAVDALPEGPERVAAGLDFFWSNYANPLFQAALDLWTAARTDPDLRAALVEVERKLDRQTLELARRLFPDLAERPDFERLIEMAAATARGLSLLDTLNPDSDRNRKQWEFCRAKLVEMFQEASR